MEERIRCLLKQVNALMNSVTVGSAKIDDKDDIDNSIMCIGGYFVWIAVLTGFRFSFRESCGLLIELNERIMIHDALTEAAVIVTGIPELDGLNA